ncbi:anti-sigma factor antagonist [Clostridia bacterium]|nr:anti-sigma factor antagonist [Clostridia bacterium]
MAISFNRKREQDAVILQISGRVDGVGSKALDIELKDLTEAENILILDFEEVKYVSSAGLRVLLNAYKVLSKKDGKISFINVSEAIREVFEMTGFVEFLNLG